MFGDARKATTNSRWRRIATGIIAIPLLYFALVAWLNRRWIDPRFVGAWQVTNSKSDVQSICVLNRDGSARWLVRGETGQWWERGPLGAPFYWSIGRDGFLSQNLNSPSSQFGAWLLSLGGFLNNGRFTAPRLASNSGSEIEYVSENQIRLSQTQPGLIIPLVLTLDRIDQSDVPPAQR